MKRGNVESQEQTASQPQAAADARRPDAVGHLIFWPIVVIGIAADLISKHAIFAWLQTVPDRQYEVINGIFRLVMWENDGAAFSIAEGRTTLLLTVSAIALVVVLAIFLFGQVHHRVMQVALGLFTAGITGNLYDRAFNDGYVRDFLLFSWKGHHWPAFNIADSMLCTAVGLLILVNITSAFSRKPAHQQTAAHPDPH
ncbi:MAG: signal peptidase II [Phycisphaerae bacterium]|nr:signal peptidase II [Phycisphaerae bacterium]